MMSIFVPKTFGFSAERIGCLVERDLGKVRQIDMVKETCFIHMDKWYEGGTRQNAYPTFLAIDRMERGEAHKITSYDPVTSEYRTLFLLKNHSKKQCQETTKEKDVLEQIEEGGVQVQVQGQSEVPAWRPPSPSGPPPPLPQTQRKEGRSASGRSASDEEYIKELERENASLRAQAAEAARPERRTRSGHTYNTIAADVEEQGPEPIAGSEYNAAAIPKPRRRAQPTKAVSFSSGGFRLATF